MWLCGCHALPKLGEGSGCVSPDLALPGKRLSSSGRAGGPAPPHGQRSLPPLREPLEAADSSLQNTPASLHPCSLDRPAQHTSASLQSRWGGPRTSAIPQTSTDPAFERFQLLQKQVDPVCTFYVGGVSSICPAVCKRSTNLGTVLLPYIPQNYNAEVLQSDKIME